MSKAYWLALSTIPNLGAVTARKLVDRFGSVEAIFEASVDELLEVPRVKAEMITSMQAIQPDQFDEELLLLSDEGVDVLTWEDDEYPLGLLSLHDAPPLLFVHGDLMPADADAVAIVGTRQPAPRSVEMAEKLATELAVRGLTVVSGLAAGIDTAAHQGALRAEEGRTLAVLGSGIRYIHPRENVELAQQVSRRGALISELHPKTPPRGRGLMARDRIISGLSRAVIIVEAAERSGSMDTAQKARRQGRLLLAMPGSPGTDLLIREGAVVVHVSDDLDGLAQRISDWTPAVRSTDEPATDSPQQLGLGF